MAHRAASLVGFLLLLGFRNDPLDSLIRDLGSDDVEVRERASAELRRRGPETRTALERARRSADPEISARAREILESRVSLELDLDFEQILTSLAEPLIASAKLINGTGDEIVAYPAGFSVRVVLLELFEEPAEVRCQFSRRYGCGGRAGCALSEDHFKRIAPGADLPRGFGDLRSRSIETSEELRAAHPAPLPGTLTAPGRYRVIATYTYDPRRYLGRCLRDCATHLDPAKPWNRCAARTLQTEAEFVILP